MEISVMESSQSVGQRFSVGTIWWQATYNLRIQDDGTIYDYL
jgi:hypothetical protein